MRKLPHLIGLGWLLIAGCHWCTPGFRVQTDNRVVLEGPINGKFTAELSPHPSADALVMVPVDGDPNPADGPKVALVDLDGLLLNHNATGLYSSGENPLALFKEKLDALARDGSVVGVVVRINSPGGSVAGTDMMWRELQAHRQCTRRPVVACVMDVGAGGGYYVATATDAIVAHPGSIVGGIGVVLNLYNLRELMAQFNVLSQTVKAGPMIDVGQSGEKLGPEARKLLQEMADEYHDRFKAVVRQARPGLSHYEPVVFDGRVFTAKQALDQGLIDRIGYLDDAVALVRERAGQPHARPVLLRRPSDPARTPYAVTPNSPLHSTLMPLSVPGIDRSKMPTFMYAWLPEPSLERLAGK
jgi:protease-4